MTKLTTVSAMLFSGLLLTLGATSAFAQAPTKPAAAPAAAPAMAKPMAAPATPPAMMAKPAGGPAAAPAITKPAANPAAAPTMAKPMAAAPAAPATPPAPPAELDTLFKPYAGSWKCDTTFVAGAFGPGSPETVVKTDVKIKKDLGGYWYKGEFKIKKSKTMPSMEGVFLLSYDTGLKAPINMTYDSMGGSAMETGPGATPEKAVFVGEGRMMGAGAKFRETMTMKGPKEMMHAFDVDMGKGFQPMGIDNCKK
ncbi:MAG TPA: DUF1579 family protein [Polyangia bacterium]|jgi:hypothetical protein